MDTIKVRILGLNEHIEALTLAVLRIAEVFERATGTDRVV